MRSGERQAEQTAQAWTRLPEQNDCPLIDLVEQRILRLVRSSEPIHIWRLLNRLVEEEAPSSRNEARKRKLALWKSVNSLLRQQILFRAGRRAVATTKPSPGLRGPGWFG